MAGGLDGQVVVITGASSGIGRASAVEAARRGAKVVLAARDGAALEEAAAEVRAAGGEAHACPTDVGVWTQVQALAYDAVGRFGHVDVWVNNAAVSEYATVDDTDPDEINRIVRVNLIGTMYGCKAALAAMRPRGRGTVVNVSSVLGKFGVPYQSVYVATKHGVKGFTDCLRLELKRENSPIRVSLVLPPSTNTPLFGHARSKIGARPRPLPPVYQPEVVAGAVVDACETAPREVAVGGAGLGFTILEQISPALVDWFLLRGDAAAQLQTSSQPEDGVDNLFRPAGVHRTHGEWDDEALSRSPSTRLAQIPPFWQAVAVGAGAVGLLALAGVFGRPRGGDGAAGRDSTTVEEGAMI